MSASPDAARLPGKLWLYTEPIRWQYTGLQPLSLWQLMEYFNAHDFAKCLQEVYSYELELQRRCEEMGDWNKPVVSGWEDKDTQKLLERVKESFPHNDFPHTSAVATRVHAFATTQCTHQELYTRIVALRETMEDELRNRKMVLISPLKADYCDKKQAFGETVAHKFPSADKDIIEAGNAYATDLNTASVFHLMRVLEKGLMALAMSLDVTYTSENWGRILEKIEVAITAIEKVPLKDRPAKHADLQFYGEAAKEFSYFKNAWRNHTMHSSVTYGESEALKIMNHVRDFMQHLSLRLSD